MSYDSYENIIKVEPEPTNDNLSVIIRHKLNVKSDDIFDVGLYFYDYVAEVVFNGTAIVFKFSQSKTGRNGLKTIIKTYFGISEDLLAQYISADKKLVHNVALYDEELVMYLVLKYGLINHDA